MSKDLRFKKIDGAGNTFLMTDQVPDIPIGDSGKRAEWVKRICSTREGFSADGVVFLKKSEKTVRWSFYNSDGSIAEMCGNAARCAGAALNLKEGTSVILETLSGAVGVERTPEGTYRVAMGRIQVLAVKVEIDLDGKLWRGALVDTGVPHFVPDDVVVDPDPVLSSRLRHHPSVGDRGANVTWIRGKTAEGVAAVTFERGVEGFTLACGTGAVAAAWATLPNGRGTQLVRMPGGTLVVDIQGEQPWLAGPVKVIGEVTISLEEK